MPPAKRSHEDPQALKEKLHALQGTNARGRRNGNANLANGNHARDSASLNGDNASSSGGQSEQTSGVSGLPPMPPSTRPTQLRADLSFLCR